MLFLVLRNGSQDKCIKWRMWVHSSLSSDERSFCLLKTDKLAPTIVLLWLYHQMCVCWTHVSFIPQIKAWLCKWVASTWDTSIRCWSNDNFPKCIPPPFLSMPVVLTPNSVRQIEEPESWRGASLWLWSVIISYRKMSRLINQTLFAKGYVSPWTPGMLFCLSERIKK